MELFPHAERDERPVHPLNRDIDYYSRSVWGHAMSEQELELVLAAIQRVRAANTATPEQARNFLQSEGVLTETGELTEPYNDKSDQSTAA